MQHDSPWPSRQLYAVLDGTLAWDNASPAIRSWASFFIFDAAKQIVLMADKEKRQTALGKIPGTIRPIVEAEVRRIWPIRDSL